MSVLHVMSLHVVTSISVIPSPDTVVALESVQLNPPYWGMGSEHVRVLFCIPPIQVFEHSVQFPHSPQFPSTGIWKKYIFCNIVFSLIELFIENFTFCHQISLAQYLLGQGPSSHPWVSVSSIVPFKTLQVSVLVEFEVQLAPPYMGLGLSHSRVLVSVPFEHVTEQSLQGSHEPQLPSTIW